LDNRKDMGLLFRELIARPQGLFGFGVGNAMEASVAEKAGTESIYLGGYTMAMYKMLPDMGMMNMVEILSEVSAVVRSTSLPVIADIDDGYGNALNSIRAASEFLGREFIDYSTNPWTVKKLAGLHIEDQKFPKRCGHIAGKEVVSREEFIGKIKAVAKVRDTLSKNSVIIARTDVYHSERPGSMEEAIDRAVASAEAGADLAWFEDNKPSRESACLFAEGVRARIPDFPLAFNYSPSLPWFKEASPLTFDELTMLGYKYIFITIAAGHASSYSVYEYAREIKNNGAQALWDSQKHKVGHPTESHHKMAKVPVWQKLEKEFVPGSGEKQKSGEGFGSRPA